MSNALPPRRLAGSQGARLQSITKSEYNSLSRKDFSFFLVESFKQMHPGVIYEDSSHLRYIGSLLGGVYHGIHKRLCLNLPPRSLKSFACSVAFVAWVLGKQPTAKFICVSYGAELAEKFALDGLTLIQSPWYQGLFKLKLKRDKVGDFETAAGGYRLSTGINGPYFGRGADYIVIDDPTKPEEALSDNLREDVNYIVTTKLRTRLDNPQEGRIVLAQQRQHVRDLTAHMTAQEPWTKAVFPAIAVRDESLPFQTCLGSDLHVRAAGDSLQPGRMPLSWLQQQAKYLGSVAFHAQYQQEPRPPGGNIVKNSWIHRYGPAEEPVQFDYLIQSWDTANTAGVASAYTVCLTIGVYNKKLYLLDCLRQQMEFPALLNAIKIQYERFPQWPRHVLIEDKASGTSLIQTAKHMGILAGGIKPKYSKEVRLQTVSALIENGTILFPTHKPWIEDFLSELTSFPQTQFADQVDALSQALEWSKNKLYAGVFECDWGYSDAPGTTSPREEDVLYLVRR
jgi:predicted phage terminase large subunit-like protein